VDDLTSIDDTSQEESAYDESCDTGGPNPSNTSVTSVIAEIMKVQNTGEPTLQGSGDEGSQTIDEEEDADSSARIQLISSQIESDLSRSRTGCTRKPNTQYSGSTWWNHQGDDDDDEIIPEDDVYVPRDSRMGQEKR
jgi:hypothetical protein